MTVSRRLATVFFLLFLSMYEVVAGAASYCCEGEDWLKWNSEARKVYVEGYIRGLQEGYAAGCNFGPQAARPNIKVDELSKASDDCWTHFPISGKNPNVFIDQITLFYKEYPKDRDIRVAEILKALYKGLSIDELHKSRLVNPVKR